MAKYGNLYEFTNWGYYACYQAMITVSGATKSDDPSKYVITVSGDASCTNVDGGQGSTAYIRYVEGSETKTVNITDGNSYCPEYNGTMASGHGAGSTTVTVTKKTTTQTYSFTVYQQIWPAGYGSGSSTVSDSITVPALDSWSISYNANGGSGAPASQTKYYGVNLTLSSSIPTRSGYEFLGWATSSTGAVAYTAGGTYSANSGATLYAVWKALSSVLPSTTSATIGMTKTITWTKYDNSFIHELWISFGSYNDRLASLLTGTSYSWTPDTKYANALPDSASGTGKLILYTYIGNTLIGSSESTLTLSIPSRWTPSVGATTTPVNTNTWISGQGIYVAGYSKVRVQATATASTGTTIAGYSITGLDSEGKSADWTSGYLTAGDKLITITAIDKRGRTNSVTETISVYSYTNPIVSKLEFERGSYVSGTWTQNDMGTDLKVTYSTSHNSLNGNNKINISLKLGSTTLDTLTNSDDVTNRVVYKTSIGSTTAYELVCNASDSVGSSTSKSVTVPTAEIPLVIDFNRNSVAIGGVPQSSSIFECWDEALFRDIVTLAGPLFWRGTALQSSDNLDDIKTKGKYTCTSSRTFGSAGSSNNFALYVITPLQSASYIFQFVIAYDTSLYIRRGTSSSWETWKKIA